MLDEIERHHGTQALVRIQLARLYLAVNEEFTARLAIRALFPAYTQLRQSDYLFKEMARLLGRAHRRLRSKRNADFWFAIANGATRPLDGIESRFEDYPWTA